MVTFCYILQLSIHLDCPSLPASWALHDWIYSKTLSAGLQLSVLSSAKEQVHFPGAAERVELFLDNILVELRYVISVVVVVVVVTNVFIDRKEI